MGSPSHKQTDMLRAAMRLLIILILLGYLMLWFMMPTNTYRHIWLRHVRNKFNSAYFGLQGLIPVVNFLPFHFWNYMDAAYAFTQMFQVQLWCYTPSPFFWLLSWAVFISIWGRDRIKMISKGNYIYKSFFLFDLLLNFSISTVMEENAANYPNGRIRW